MNTDEQGELFGIIWRPFRDKSKLRVNDIIRIDGRLSRVIRVNECAAVVLINQSVREFTTRFRGIVRFQPAPATIRISVNSETEILNRALREKKKKRRQTIGKGSNV